MSDERDELADLLCEDAAADRAKAGGRALLVPVVRSKAEAAADKILAAGYRKPQQVTTVEELKALPNGSVIRDKFNDVSERRYGYWCGYETAPLSDQLVKKYLPATVLHVGGAE